MKDELLDYAGQCKRVLDNLGEILFVLDVKGYFVYANKVALKTFKYSPKELRKLKYSDVLHKDSLGKATDALRRRMRGENIPRYRVKAVSRDGVERTYEVSGSVIRAEGKVAGVLVLAKDVTVEDCAKRMLEESSELYEVLVSTSPDAVTVTGLDGRIIYVSRQTLRLHGYRNASELIGLSAFKIIAPEDREKAYKNLRKTLKQGHVRGLEYVLLRKDGSRFIGELNASCIKSADGRPKAFIATVRDITERKYAENSLRESEDKFRNLAEQSPNMIFINQKGRIIYVNNKCIELLGYGRDEFYSPEFNFFTLVQPSYKKLLTKNFKRHMQGRDVPPVEYSLITKKGGKIDAILTTKVIKYRGENAILGIVTDITERKRAEEALLESEKRYRGLIESQTDLIVRVDTGGRFTFVNDAYCQTFGKKREELLGGRFIPLVHKDDRKKTLDAMKGLEKPPYRIYVEQRALTSEGWRWLAWEDYAIRGDDGKTVEIQAVGRDITQRVTFEEQLRQLNEFLSDILQNAPVGILTTDAAGNVLSANRALLRILGSPRESETKKFNVLKMPSLRKYGISDMFRRVLAEGRKVSADGVYYKSVWGSEVIAQLRVVPLWSSSKRVSGSVAIIDDVTLQYSLEKEVSDIKEHLETVINGIDESIVVIDKNYRIVSHNAAFLDSLRSPQKGVKGGHCYNVIHGFLNPCRRCVVREMFKTGEPVGDVHYHLEKEGKIYHEVKAYPLTDSTGKIIQAVYLFRDVTEREVLYERVIQAKEAAEELARMKSEFASIASHELKTPLAIIKGYAELMSSGMLGPVNSSQKKKLESIVGNINRLNSLVGKLLDISKLESGGVKLSLEDVSLKSLIESVVLDMERLAGEKRLSLNVSYRGNIPAVRVDSMLIKQVLFNLIDNAVKFTHVGGVIRIAVRRSGGSVVVSVSDTGIGIPRKELRKLGQKFYQVDSSVSRQYKGAGLGLAICKRILSMHGGELSIKSMYGQGTTVSFTIPVQGV